MKGYLCVYIENINVVYCYILHALCNFIANINVVFITTSLLIREGINSKTYKLYKCV